MRIWIDGYEANVKDRLGSGQVAFELLKNIEEIDKENEYTILLPDEPFEDLPKEREKWNYKKLSINRFKTILGIPLTYLFSSHKPDIFFSPTHYIPRFINCKKVGTIFDLSYIHFPEMFGKADLYKLTNWSEYTVKNSDHLITISNFSKNDIIKQYKIGSKKITVAYPGYDEKTYKRVSEAQVKEAKIRFKVEGDYIVYIGTLQPRKNLIRLIEAVAQIENVKLLIIGKSKGEGREGWKYEEILNHPKKLGIEERVIFCGYLEKVEVASLLSGAKMLCLVSLWEGFGIPVIEAFGCGIPVVVSDSSSLPEIAGDSGLYVDPYSVGSIKDAIENLLNDKKLWNEKSKLAAQQAKKFSWQKMSRQVLEVFKNTKQ